MKENNFHDELLEFLNNECDDYGITYRVKEFSSEDNRAIVEINRYENSIDVEFRYRTGQLEIDMYEDIWQSVDWFEPTVKYFWMLVSPVLFARS